MMTAAQWGISVVICCHNSVPRLPPTLEHLLIQDIPPSVQWEVLVIDNGSTDNTAQVARSIWSENQTRVPLRVISEAKLGLIHARLRGLSEATYEIISFIDDDNWVCPIWVKTVEEIMRHHPTVAVCGGLSDVVFESPPPDWFQLVQSSFAVGQQAAQSGDVTEEIVSLWGAGLTLRKAAWAQLIEAGYQPILIGREGQSLASGEDTETCLALRLAGWRWWYDDRLTLQHFMPKHRVDWSYLRRLKRAKGRSSIGIDPYLLALMPVPMTIKERVKQTWFGQALFTLKFSWRAQVQMLIYRILQKPTEGQPFVAIAEYNLGRVLELIKRRGTYQSWIKQIASAPWRDLTQ